MWRGTLLDHYITSTSHCYTTFYCLTLKNTNTSCYIMLMLTHQEPQFNDSLSYTPVVRAPEPRVSMRKSPWLRFLRRWSSSSRSAFCATPSFNNFSATTISFEDPKMFSSCCFEASPRCPCLPCADTKILNANIHISLCCDRAAYMHLQSTTSVNGIELDIIVNLFELSLSSH